jgi:hypothetical protein
MAMLAMTLLQPQYRGLVAAQREHARCNCMLTSTHAATQFHAPPANLQMNRLGSDPPSQPAGSVLILGIDGRRQVLVDEWWKLFASAEPNAGTYLLV